MNVLVTGGAGMIGSHLVARLLSEDCRVTIVDNFWRGTRKNCEWLQSLDKNNRLTIVEGDLCDSVIANLVTKEIDTVFHLADIVSGIEYVFGNQYFIFHKNCLINTNILKAAIDNSVRNYVYVGTACSYPYFLQTGYEAPPLKESDILPANPESSYGWSKLVGELEAGYAGSEDLIEVGVARLHNVYGPRCDIGVATSQVIPALCRKVVEATESIDVFGSGEQSRGFVYVEDICDGLIQMLSHGMNKGAIQLGPTIGTQIKTLAETIIEISEKNLNIAYDLAKPEGDKGRIADAQKASDLLGWAPRTSLQQGLQQTYAYVKQALGC